ncbi:MAG TPA: SusC/RagA family TonB-linked outer membrane protein, partial [Arachidicoccus soli]|nr:SusC/RagA family TonB-linked outer membrane protein [Arachidicoccus soli]
TTKKGSANSPASINIDQQYGVSNLANKKPFESFMNSKELTDLWVETGYRTQSQVDDLLKQYPNDTKWYQYYYQKNVPTYQTNLSVSGGGNKTTYYVSGNYFSQEGLAYRSAYKRYSVRSNVSSTVTKWMKFGLNFFISYDDRQTNPYGSNSTNRGLAMLAQPFYSPIDPTTGKEYEGIIPGWGRYAPNYLADKNPSIGNNLQIDPSAFIEITPIKNLTLRTQAGMDAYIYTSQSNRLPSYAGSLNNGSTSQSYERGVERTITNTAEYKFVVNTNHHFTLLAGQEYNDYDDNSFSGSSSGQSDDRLILLQNGPNNKSVSSGRTQYVYNSYFGKFDYSYLSKYYFSATIRQDQSSRFGIDNRNANFWSVGVNWKAKKENFLADIDWLTDLSVRANIGTSGNSAIGNYQSLATVGTSQYDGATGWNISAPGNPSLAWESQIQSSFGVNFTLFDRARLDVLYYRRTTKNMLVDVPYPYTSGFASVTSNVGALENNGLDVSIDFDVLKSKDAYITPYVVMNYNKNKVTKLFQGKDYWIIPNTGVSWAIGKPVSFFYPIFDQVNPQTGAPEWYLPDANNPTITQKDPTKVTSDFDPNVLQQNTGLPLNSPFNGGFGLKGGYKGIYVQADFSFYNKKYLINNARYFYENANVFTGFNQSKVVANYWKKPGDIAQFPDYDNYQFMQFDSRLLENASFIRLKVLTVGYRLPTKLLESTRAIKGVNIYFTGRNLLTSTKYLGEDPEVDSNLALGTNPNTKQYTLGVTLNF